MTNMNWKSKAAGVWQGTAGILEKVTPLSVNTVSPREEALNKMMSCEMPFDFGDIKVDFQKHRSVISIPLEPDEQIYGFGLQFMRINHRGFTRFLRINSDPKEDTGESHAPLPFYISSKGYGIMVNTSRISSFYVGSCVKIDSRTPAIIKNRTTDDDWLATPQSDQVEIVIPNEKGVELLVFGGPTMLNAICRYNLYLGGGALPPLWGLGFWHRSSMFYNAEQILEEAKQFRERNIPCDVIGLEPGWHSNSYPTTYEWNKQLFPDPDAFIANLQQQGFRVNLWENPYVAPIASIYQKLLPYAGSHTVWNGIAPDYTIPEAVSILTQQHEAEHLQIGVSGYKIDEVDGSELTPSSWMFPTHAQFPSGLDGEQMRQIYGVLMQRITTDMFRKRNQRTYGLVRGSNIGTSSLPYVLYSDLYDHRQFVRALCNAGFSGLLWTPELREAQSSEEYIRRLQVVCFSPLAMLNAFGSGITPWSDPAAEVIVTKYIQLRMRLLPYLYSAFGRYNQEGFPPIRAMVLEMDEAVNNPIRGSALVDFDSTNAAYGRNYSNDIDDQYMFGDHLLIAPIFTGETSRIVELPHGNWYDFETGECFAGGMKINIKAQLDKIPVFVRDGAIIPLMPPLPHTPRSGDQVSLEIRHYGRAEGSFLLYEDDGDTFDYEQGKYRWTRLEVEIKADGSYIGKAIKQETDGCASLFGAMNWVYFGKELYHRR